MQFFCHQNARKIEELLKKYLNEQKYALFLMLRLQCHAEICIMAARYGEMGEWLKPRPC